MHESVSDLAGKYDVCMRVSDLGGKHDVCMKVSDLAGKYDIHESVRSGGKT